MTLSKCFDHMCPIYKIWSYEGLYGFMIAPFRIAAKNSINQILNAYMKLMGDQSTCTVLEYIANCDEQEKVINK